MRFPKVDKKLIKLYLNSTSEGIFILDSNRQITFCNNRYLEITGVNGTDIKGKVPTSVGDGWHATEFYDHLWDIVNKDGCWEDEVWDSIL